MPCPGSWWRRSVQSKPGLLWAAWAADINSMGAHYSALNQLVHPLFVQSLTITQPQIAQYELFQTFDPGLTKSWNLLCCQQESFGVTSSGWMLRHARRRGWDAQFKSKVNNPQSSPDNLEFQSKINRLTPALARSVSADDDWLIFRRVTPHWSVSAPVWWWGRNNKPTLTTRAH